MIKYKSNCHTHTNYCDGKSTAEEMVRGAIDKDFSTIGFSGHCPMSFENNWGMTQESLDKYYKDVNLLKKKYKDKVDILCGIELDSDYSFDGEYNFDYVICAVHQLHRNGKIYYLDYSAEMSAECVNSEFGGSWNEMAREYYRIFSDFVLSEKCDIVAHFDLITKFNENFAQFNEDDAEYQSIALEAVEKILREKPDVLFEVNTGAMFRCNNSRPYPAEFILRRICEKGGRVTVTADAHQPEALDFCFDKAVDYCRKCGFDKVYHLTGKGITEEKI